MNKKLSIYLSVFCVISGLIMYFTGTDKSFLNGFIVGSFVMDLLNEGIAYYKNKAEKLPKGV